MKLRVRFLALLALAGAVFTGCRQEERDYDLPSIRIDGPELAFDADTKKAQTVVVKAPTVEELYTAEERARFEAALG